MSGKCHLVLRISLVSLCLIALLVCPRARVSASDPYSAYYGSYNDRLFWFVHISDIHIGASGAQDSTNLNWLVTQAKSVIQPSFIVATGDLTDSTDGGLFPNGPYQSEWNQYRSIVDGSVSADSYYDLPGNHEAYNDRYFTYYRLNSIQGRATNATQVSWTRSFTFGTYLFIGLNTADNTGSGFSIFPPYGDHAGLDAAELSFIDSELRAHAGANLNLIFGHHPIVPTGNSSDTYLYYGATELEALMNSYLTSLYGFGHTHVFDERFFTKGITNSAGVFYFNVASLGKSSGNNFTLKAIDCDGLSSVTQTVNTWPLVLITAPLDSHLGGVENPYNYPVYNTAGNPIRALVFDPGTISRVEYRIDDTGSWYPMSPTGLSQVWSALWDASALLQGDHSIRVQATTSSGVRSNIINVKITAQSTSPRAGAGAIEVGKYVNTGTRRNPVMTFQTGVALYPGDTVVMRTPVRDLSTNTPLSGATAKLSITGPQNTTLTSSASGPDGYAVAQWKTTAPGKRSSGTPAGAYTATVTGVTASGYSWDGVEKTGTFTLTAR